MGDTNIIKQEIIYNKKDFLLLQSMNKNRFIAISPFEKLDNGMYNSNFIISSKLSNRAYRLRNLAANNLKLIAEKNIIKLDLFSDNDSEFNKELFGNINKGIIYIDTISVNKEKNDGVEQKVTIRNIIQKIESDKMVTINTKPTSFKTDSVKIFTLLFDTAYMVSIINENSAELFLTAEINGGLKVGNTHKILTIDLIRKFMPIWPIFKAEIENKLTVSISANIAEQLTPLIMGLNKDMVLLHFKRKLDEDVTSVSLIGVGE